MYGATTDNAASLCSLTTLEEAQKPNYNRTQTWGSLAALQGQQIIPIGTERTSQMGECGVQTSNTNFLVKD